MTTNVETLFSRQLMVHLKRNSTEVTLNHIYLQTASIIQLTVTKFVQPKQLYTSNGVKL
jgi:chorismate mutase